MTTTEAPIVVRDVFPARVVVGDRVLTSARVVITRDRLYVYLNRRGPALDQAYDPERSTVPAYSAPASEPAHLALLDEVEGGYAAAGLATVTRQRGCGCGSPVRGWRPWSPWQVAS